MSTQGPIGGRPAAAHNQPRSTLDTERGDRTETGTFSRSNLLRVGRPALRGVSLRPRRHVLLRGPQLRGPHRFQQTLLIEPLPGQPLGQFRQPRRHGQGGGRGFPEGDFPVIRTDCEQPAVRTTPAPEDVLAVRKGFAQAFC